MNARAPRILVVRLSAIGDVLHGLPVLNALRDAMPQAYLGWVVEGRAADLLVGHRALDELFVVRRGWLKSPRCVLDLRRRLRRARFDITIDVQGLTKSALAARLSGARRRIGFAGASGRELSRWLNNLRVLPTVTHVVDQNLQLLAPLGIQPAPARFDVPEAIAEAATAERIAGGLLPAADYALLNPGAGWKSKLWPTERFAAVARHLGRRHALPTLVVWAGATECACAEQIVAGSAGQARLVPPTTLGELAALARRARLFVSSDTGPLHLAAAVGTPCVGLFGPMPAERNGPYGPNSLAVQQVCLAGTSRERRNAGPESMLAISVDHVTAACDELLSRPSARRSA